MFIAEKNVKHKFCNQQQTAWLIARLNAINLIFSRTMHMQARYLDRNSACPSDALLFYEKNEKIYYRYI